MSDPLTGKGKPDRIPADAQMLVMEVWNLCAMFYNARRAGSLTIHFGEDGRFASWDSKFVGKF